TGSRAYAQSKLAMIASGFVLARELAAESITVNSLHPATLMPTRMVEEGYGYTVDDLATGVMSTQRLIEAEEVSGVSGAYFSGTARCQAAPQAYEPDFQQWLWQLSKELTGTTL